MIHAWSPAPEHEQAADTFANWLAEQLGGASLYRTRRDEGVKACRIEDLEEARSGFGAAVKAARECRDRKQLLDSWAQAKISGFLEPSELASLLKDETKRCTLHSSNRVHGAVCSAGSSADTGCCAA